MILVFIDADLSMKTHVARTVSACFAVLPQLRSIRRSVPRPVLQKLVVSLVYHDWITAMLHFSWHPDVPAETTIQSVLNAAARLVSSPRRDHVSPLLRQLYWLKAPEGSSISSPFWFTSASTEWRSRIWQMSFSSRRTLPPGNGFVRHRHCSFAVPVRVFP